MDNRTIAALEASISHWEDNLAAKTIAQIKIGPENCALRKEFLKV